MLKRPEITFDNIKNFIEINYAEDVIEQVEINIKYEGYLIKAEKEAEKMLKLESKFALENIDYDKVKNIAIRN